MGVCLLLGERKAVQTAEILPYESQKFTSEALTSPGFYLWSIMFGAV